MGEPLSANTSLQVSEAASRYASALLDLAIDQNSLTQTESELTAVGKAVKESKELKTALETPAVSAEEKAGILGDLAKKMGLTSLVSNFLGVVADQRRANEITDIVHAFQALSAQKRGVTRASVISATPLDAAQVKELEDLVASVSGGEVSMDVSIDPALIAGFQLKIGSRLIDASVKSKLDRMNLAMKGA
ncbi:MAG: ATP synthase F1 subunit delta [Ponticaulis sp.]|nr:ATP synthase F1 subunit delta [Ponticaulis sp.]